MNDQERATVLAALHAWKNTLPNYEGTDSPAWNLATDMQTHAALTPEEIDQLCARLNATDWTNSYESICPECGSPDFYAGHVEIEGPETWQRLTCEAEGCDTRWIEVYRLTTIVKELEHGEQLDMTPTADPPATADATPTGE